MKTSLSFIALFILSFNLFAGIEVRTATYGSNCGAPQGNQTFNLAQACNGRLRCDYVIDHRVIGDPAIGCAKDYQASYYCTQNNTSWNISAGPEASGRTIQLSCGDTGIEILSASYGANCGVPSGNQTSNLQRACDHRISCDYIVNHNVIGDPAVGCAKDYTVRYRCRNDGSEWVKTLTPEASGKRLYISCP